MWPFGSLRKKYDLQKHMLGPDSQGEVRYLNRVLRRGAWSRVDCDPKHARGVWDGTLQAEGPPLTSGGPEKSGARRAKQARPGGAWPSATTPSTRRRIDPA